MTYQEQAKVKSLLLKMSGIKKNFGPVSALSNVDLTVQPATVHAIVGENGAGKSTLMKILAGVYKPDAGTIKLNNQSHQFTKPHDSLAAGVSMIYQELDLAQHLTVAENILLGSEPKGPLPLTIDIKKMNIITKQLANYYGFKIDPTETIENLTIAQAQVVEILKALARNSSIIVMDEPTSSLSQAESLQLFQTINNLREKGISIIYISHRLEEIIDLADDITILRDGQLIHTSPMKDLNIPKIINLMVGRELTDFFPQRDAQITDETLKLDNVSSTNGTKNISFTLHKGQVLGLAGLVGSGRTELAKIIFGIDKPSSGNIYLNKQKTKITSPKQAIKKGIALLTEDRKRTGLCLDLSCCANITLSCLKQIGFKHFIRPSAEKKIVDDIASKISVKWPNSSAPAADLSGGNQQKLLIARWLLTGSDIIIFDEPTRGIDVAAKTEIYQLINTLASQGKAIILISSELPELLGMTDDILVFRDNTITAKLKTNQTTQRQIMSFAALKEN